MNKDQRQEFRLEQSETIFIEVKTAYSEHLDHQSQLLICRSADVSANGIRAVIDEELPVGAIYQLAVDLNQRRLCLVAQVKWLRQSQLHSGFEVGLMILDSDDTDVELWKLHIADQLSSSI